MFSKLSILIAGYGSIGKRHLKNIKRLCPNAEVALLRQFSKDVQPVDGVAQIFTGIEDALAWKPQVVFVTNPAPYHVPTALAFARSGADLFLEKPLAVDLEGVEGLMREVQEHQVIAMVGYVLRFSKPLGLIKSLIDQGRIGKVLSFYAHVGRYLPQWRPGTDYRQNVTARAELGGGVILELSHEFDYARWLVGEVTEVQAMTDRLGGFDINVEDVSLVNLRFANGALGHVHLDMFDHASNRGCRIVGSEGTVRWGINDDGAHEVGLFDGKKGAWENILNAKLDTNEMYERQISHFFDCIRQRKAPSIDLQEGFQTLRLTHAVKGSALQGKRVVL